MLFYNLLFIFSVGSLSVGRQEAFDIFLADYEHNQSIEDNKRTLKYKYAEAKSLGETLNKSKNRISKNTVSCFK